MNEPRPAPRPPPPPPGRSSFRARPPPEKILSLRRRLSLTPSADSIETRKSINAIMAATRAPWGEQRTLDSHQVAELQKSLRVLQSKLKERGQRPGSTIGQPVLPQMTDVAAVLPHRPRWHHKS